VKSPGKDLGRRLKYEAQKKARFVLAFVSVYRYPNRFSLCWIKAASHPDLFLLHMPTSMVADAPDEFLQNLTGRPAGHV